MKVVLLPDTSFDNESRNTIYVLVNIAKKLLKKWKVPIPENIEFYNNVSMIIKRINDQVKTYGLTADQSREFIKSSLHSGVYITVDPVKKSIIAMNYNPHFQGFFPAMQFLKMIIHESLHLQLYQKVKHNIYEDKFKFKSGKYIGNSMILQLDEGYATFLTDNMLPKRILKQIRHLPIWTTTKDPPHFKTLVGNLKIRKFVDYFDKLYSNNVKNGVKIIKTIYNKIKVKNQILKVGILSKEVAMMLNYQYE